MTPWRRITGILFGARGPADIVVTRSESGTTFHLPNQRLQWDAQATLLTILIVGVAYGIFLAVNGTLRFPEDERNYSAMAVCVAILIAAAFLIYFRTRIDWHYELILTPAELSVQYVASGKRWRTVRIDMVSVRQLTIVRSGNKSLLQAEFQDDSVTLLLREQAHDRLVKLANVLAQERATIAPALPPLFVAIETPRSIQAEGAGQPLNSKIVLTRHETGVTLDFPLPDDPRYRTRRIAWGIFEVGIITLVGTLIGFVVLEMLELRAFQVFAVFPFLAGLLCLLLAAQHSQSAWQNSHLDNDLRQLSVAGNLLIRTARDHRKQIWYREEIRAIALVEDKFETITTVMGGNAQQRFIQLIHLVVELHNGEHMKLRSSGVEWSDDLPKAELEWIATELRQALHKEPPTDESAHAIQDMDAGANKTRITS